MDGSARAWVFVCVWRWVRDGLKGGDLRLPCCACVCKQRVRARRFMFVAGRHRGHQSAGFLQGKPVLSPGGRKIPWGARGGGRAARRKKVCGGAASAVAAGAHSLFFFGPCARCRERPHAPVRARARPPPPTRVPHTHPHTPGPRPCIESGRQGRGRGARRRARRNRTRRHARRPLSLPRPTKSPPSTHARTRTALHPLNQSPTTTMSTYDKSGVSAAQADAARRALAALLREEANRRCAECGARGPTWA